ncbi:SusC/RagA family TonB-linked outer membrane protein [Polaribacter sp. ALD11]|uniref:SusC/RagA family TonB-linked outer membrane protein n=1 Tax=Polaribacter sp. ALD11 TaxID=2058137 RepID=UPI000C30921C|nr:SusC/RagA family TonB-linked outer membrane protein [Polaribacter sp. ALD11]AUC86179.1 SusC/RagA family TonB-linked outer membrane protein [Polaribacter sp. ALD11]
MKKSISIFITMLFFSAILFAQEKSIVVTVVDGAGAPIPGASVIVKETTKGWSTDFDGVVTIKSNSGSIVVISSLGYMPKEVTISNEKKIKVSLQESSSQLEEIVVVAYGTQKKETITSSVVSIDSDKLADVTTPEVATMLQGKVTGVQVLPSGGSPGSSPNILIRGRSSINSTNSPLWVIDGVIVGNSDPKLNPNDVASISVLKDASATSLYGNRGANGVIIVTTKRGKIGAKPQIKVSIKTAVNQFNPGGFELMNSRELYDYHTELGNTSSWFNEDLLSRDYDWVDGATKDAFVKDASLTFTAATETHNLFISTGYYEEDGTVKGNKLNRYTFRTNLDYNINDKLTIKPKINFVFDNRDNTREAPLYEAYTNMPWDLPFNKDGSVVNANTAQGDDWLGRDKRNYFFDQQWNYSNSESFDLFASFDFDYKITSNLTYISTNNFRYGTYESFSYSDPRSNGGRTSNGALSDYTYRGLSRFTNQMLKFSNSYGEKHTVNALLAYEYNDSSSKNISARSENILVNGQVQDVGIKPAAVVGNENESAQQSFLFSADYDYDGLYFVKGSLRVDGASAFAKDYRYGEFYSIAAGWNVHKEDFFNIDQINKLKLRASYGAVGNQPGGFGFLDLYDVRFQYAGIIAAKPFQLATENLTWEKSIETNIGIDTRLFNVLDVTVDYYNKENSGLLYFRKLSDQTGFGGRYQNIGSITNKGVEFSLAADIVNKKDFGISAGLNMSFNDNTVDKLSEGTDIIGGSTIIREGEELGTFYMRKWLGVDPATGEPSYEVVDATTGERTTTNVYNDATNQISGTSNADFTGGFNTAFRYKNFTLSSNWSYSYGSELYNSSRNLFDSDGFYLQFNQMKLPEGSSRWQQPGDIATHPKAVVGGYPGGNQTSTRYLEDGSYLRLNNVRFSYDVSESVLGSLGLSGMNFYITGDNLVTFTNFTGVDPTIGGANGSVSLGYPIPRRYALGLNITF